MSPFTLIFPDNAQGVQVILELALLILIFALFYFLLIRPQQQKQREMHGVLEALKLGDVATASKPSSHDNTATLKRLIEELQHENGFRIDEIASLRMEMASLGIGRN